eukprot:1294907-Prymnesium_polylepis.2
MGTLASITQSIDVETACKIAEGFGAKVTIGDDIDEEDVSMLGVIEEEDDPSALLSAHRRTAHAARTTLSPRRRARLASFTPSRVASSRPRTRRTHAVLAAWLRAPCRAPADRDDHGARRPRQDIATRRTARDQRRVGRGGRHHAAHRRVPDLAARLGRHDHLHRHARPRRLVSAARRSLPPRRVARRAMVPH